MNLNSNKSFKILKWRNILNFNDTLKMTAEWYKEYFRKKKVEDFSLRQIKIYKDKLRKFIKMKVIILAGGLGTRLSEYTKTIPKPMVEILGTPLIVHIMKHYANNGSKNF